MPIKKSASSKSSRSSPRSSSRSSASSVAPDIADVAPASVLVVPAVLAVPPAPLLSPPSAPLSTEEKRELIAKAAMEAEEAALDESIRLLEANRRLKAAREEPCPDALDEAAAEAWRASQRARVFRLSDDKQLAMAALDEAQREAGLFRVSQIPASHRANLPQAGIKVTLTEVQRAASLFEGPDKSCRKIPRTCFFPVVEAVARAQKNRLNMSEASMVAVILNQLEDSRVPPEATMDIATLVRHLTQANEDRLQWSVAAESLLAHVFQLVSSDSTGSLSFRESVSDYIRRVTDLVTMIHKPDEVEEIVAKTVARSLVGNDHRSIMRKRGAEEADEKEAPTLAKLQQWGRSCDGYNEAKAYMHVPIVRLSFDLIYHITVNGITWEVRGDSSTFPRTAAAMLSRRIQVTSHAQPTSRPQQHQIRGGGPNGDHSAKRGGLQTNPQRAQQFVSGQNLHPPQNWQPPQHHSDRFQPRHVEYIPDLCKDCYHRSGKKERHSMSNCPKAGERAEAGHTAKKLRHR